MLTFSFRTWSRPVAATALLVLSLVVAGPLGSVRAEEIADPIGDFLPTYTGALDPGLDVVAHEVTLLDDHLIFFGRMAGPIAPTQAIGGVYLIGLDRGRGTPRFRNGSPVVGPNVLFDSVLRINPNGTGAFTNIVSGGIVTTLDPADIRIDGDEFIASVPLSVLTPAATRPACEWTYNVWPRNGVGQNVQISDLAPDDGNSPVHTVPEVAVTTDLDGLWPPNHKLVEVGVFIHATDACTDAADLVLEVIVTSDEPDDAPGDADGDTTGDTHGDDGFTAPVDVTRLFTFNPATGDFEGSVFLRAERAGDNGGRTYTIEATVLNDDNNWATSSCVVVVPHDQSQ
jgi:hypothetical protein